MKRLLTYFLLLTALGLVTACGWQLRGAPSLPDEMSVIYIDTRNPHGRLARELTRLLDSGDARVTRKRDEATAVLRILDTSSQRRVLSVNLAGRPEEIRVIYRVEFDVRSARGETLIERQRMVLNRDISTDPADPLGASQEASRLAQALEEEIVQSVVLRIQALARNLPENDNGPTK
ncbi:LPS-assembly lipoprotein LptE [Natronospira bacteriovora]|uniref:LPS-assembly lipoprotein LptE n=1 Tax=Natronospira bacteriovora TaxID=3069753 RepID=A0ABU0W7A2_9GAMM|nr:LPS assembly lipoprotein LptE [Natronospira sp. AB-CW4]MDQ2069909.1 LPS assembly lipoprotein LptE [Natronospira sp. AB-CW4]